MEARPKGPHTQNGDVTTLILVSKIRSHLYTRKVSSDPESSRRWEKGILFFRAFRTKRLHNDNNNNNINIDIYKIAKIVRAL